MSDESNRFRARARQCRELAEVAKDDHSRQTLSQMAVDLSEEADRIDAEEASRRFSF